MRPTLRILSGGQTGVDRAALDVALTLGMPCGGWCPKGRLAENGVIPDTYPMSETPTTDYAERTTWNVRDSDATLIVTWGTPTNGTAFTVDCAKQQGKTYFIVDMNVDKNLRGVIDWVNANNIRTLNVAGPRESKQPGAYAATKALLTQLFALLARE